MDFEHAEVFGSWSITRPVHRQVEDDIVDDISRLLSYPKQSGVELTNLTTGPRGLTLFRTSS